MTSHFITPETSGGFNAQLKSCIDQLEKCCLNFDPDYGYLVLHTFFISATDLSQFSERSELIVSGLSERFGSRQPALNIVAQDPEEGTELVLELIYKRPVPGIQVHYKNNSRYSYCVVEQGNYKEVYGGVSANGLQVPVRDSSEKAFKGMVSILAAEGLHLGNIVRQWNYIERITDLEDRETPGQNYQDFNETRANYYANADFSNGYPAATGIGVKTGAVAIAFIALSESEKVRIRPIQNPRQVNAHQYSEKVIEEGSHTGVGQKSTPKFERGKLVSINGHNYFFVSGTASIVGEQSLHPGDVEKQTITTIENILQLFSKENQEDLGVNLDKESMVFAHLRVYVKYSKDIQSVKALCQSMLNSRSTLYLVSDICRDELLVEIEGISILNSHHQTLPGQLS